jgi:hypothetical protein
VEQESAAASDSRLANGLANLNSALETHREYLGIAQTYNQRLITALSTLSPADADRQQVLRSAIEETQVISARINAELLPQLTESISDFRNLTIQLNASALTLEESNRIRNEQLAILNEISTGNFYTESDKESSQLSWEAALNDT